jgi:hypothetical protein
MGIYKELDFAKSLFISQAETLASFYNTKTLNNRLELYCAEKPS